MKWDTVAIVGVGLIGGSIGLRLRREGLASHVVGIGRNPHSLRRAKRCGAISTATTDWKKGLANAELVIVCTPVGSIVEHVRRAAEFCAAGALLTDVGSTKDAIVQQLDATLNGSVTFVGSHPLAGSEKTGPEAARPDLFDGKLVVVTPTRRTKTEAVKRIEQFWRSLGARVVRKSPAAHDAALAATSHAPHVIASALAAATPLACLPFAASGWCDSTRIAAGDTQLWLEILLDNREQILQSLDQFERTLSAYRTALQHGDAKKLARLWEAGKQHRESVASSSRTPTNTD